MNEELYVNKRGFKCVRSQLAKTDGYDPQEYEAAKQRTGGDAQAMQAELSKLKCKAPEFQ